MKGRTKWLHATPKNGTREPRAFGDGVCVSRNAFEGGEFDWFAVDADGHIGHFSTAGYGPVPLPVLERLDADQTDEVWSLGERLLDLPVIGEATGHLPGRIDDWLELARRGLFGFDWQHWSGPYRRAATPSNPITITDLPVELQPLLQLIEWRGVRLAETDTIRPEELCSCG